MTKHNLINNNSQKFLRFVQYSEALKSLPPGTPKLCLDLDLLDKNIATFNKMTEGKNIRIASKSLRCFRAINYIMQKTSNVSGVMTYQLSESLHLHHLGVQDILLAYPTVDVKSLELLAQNDDAIKNIRLMVDHRNHLQILQTVAAKYNVKFLIVIDVDMSLDLLGLHFGVWRSSLRKIKDIERLLTSLPEFPNLILEGAMGYEAQIAGVQDFEKGIKNYFLYFIIRLLKRISRKKCKIFREEIFELFKQFQLKMKIYNGAGTGSIRSAMQESALTEITIGSGYYAPTLFDNYGHLTLSPALFYALPITRHPEKNIYTCMSGGFIASGEVGEKKQPSPYLPSAMKLIPNEGMGEVQSPVEIINEGLDFKLGDYVFFRPAKAGEICERFLEIHFIRGNQVVEIAKTYRGEGLNFF